MRIIRQVIYTNGMLADGFPYSIKPHISEIKEAVLRAWPRTGITLVNLNSSDIFPKHCLVAI
jgi:hypothetical protein